MKPFSYKTRARAVYALSLVLPEGNTFDRLIVYANFIMAHGRRPGLKRSMADEIYRVRTDGTMNTPECVFTSCKACVKDYVAGRVGPEFIVPTLGVLRSRADVWSFAFPDRCCIKSTHGSGQVAKRIDGEEIDREAIADWLEHSHYRQSRETNYRYLRPAVIVEPLLFEGRPLVDYRLFCVNGTPRMAMVDYGTGTKVTRALFTPDWRRLEGGLHYDPIPDNVPRPQTLSEMIRIAERLAEPFDFVRIDFYSEGDALYVGEITHSHGGGSQRFYPEGFEETVSDVLFGDAAK